MRNFRRSSAALLAVFLAACSMVPDYERPATPAPAVWPAAAQAKPAAEAVTPGWWRRFNSAELDGLMAEAMIANQDLAAAIARIDQARANARVAGAPLLPTLDGSGSANRTYGQLDENTDGRNTYQGLLTANYELDIWGKNAAGLQSAEAAVSSSVYDRDAILL